MNKTMMLVIGAVLVASLAPSARAGEAAMLCKYRALAEIVGVTPAQEPAMAKILAELDARLKAWDTANASKLAALDAELAAARKSKNMQGMCTVMNKKQALKAERAKLAGPYLARLIAQLTPDQRAVWEGDALFKDMHRAFIRFRLSRTQVDDIRTRCAEAGKAVAALLAARKAGEITSVRTTLSRDIVLHVLTSRQRERFAGPAEGYARDKETPAQRAERIRLAAMGFANKRLAERMRRSGKAIGSAVSNAADAARNVRTGSVSDSSRTTTKRRASSGSGGCPPAAST